MVPHQGAIHCAPTSSMYLNRNRGKTKSILAMTNTELYIFVKHSDTKNMDRGHCTSNRHLSRIQL